MSPRFDWKTICQTPPIPLVLAAVARYNPQDLTMPEPKRLESRTRREAADRDSRAEALLVDGLERYFAGQYDDAVHLWTRVLFLDRSHARARAYIDRARTAIAERQRRGDELLQATGDLLARGETGPARDLLREVVAATGDDERAATLRLQLERLERLERVGSADRRRPPPSDAPPAIVDAVPVPAPRSRWTPVLIGAAIGTTLIAVLTANAGLRRWIGAGSSSQPLPAVAGEGGGGDLSTAEIALLRARTLYAHGRLAEALAALDRIDAGSASEPAADALRTEIQHVLLASRRSPAAP
jgi:hypothetical protein